MRMLNKSNSMPSMGHPTIQNGMNAKPRKQKLQDL